MAKNKTKKQVTITIGIDIAERLQKIAKEEDETFSDVCNDCLKLGEAEYLLYKKVSQKYLTGVLKEKEEKLKLNIEEDAKPQNPTSSPVANKPRGLNDNE